MPADPVGLFREDHALPRAQGHQRRSHPAKATAEDLKASKSASDIPAKIEALKKDLEKASADATKATGDVDGKAANALKAGDTAWMLVSTLLVLMMAVPGLALFYGGMVRSKNVLSVLAQCLARDDERAEIEAAAEAVVAVPFAEPDAEPPEFTVLVIEPAATVWVASPKCPAGEAVVSGVEVRELEDRPLDARPAGSSSTATTSPTVPPRCAGSSAGCPTPWAPTRR